MPTQGVVNIGRAQHKWSDQDRTLVAVLDRCYIMTRSDQQQIFNVICKETLKREGYDSDSYSGVNAQMKELKAGGKGFRFWRIVMELPAASVMAIFSDERKSIEEAAGQVGVVLELSSEFDEFVSQAKAPAMKERISGSVQVAQATLQLPKSDIMAEVSVKSTALSNPRRIFIGVEIPMTHKAGRNKLPRREIISASPPRREENILDILRRVRLSPKLRSNKDFEGNFSIGGHPTILFRAFEPEHRFRARRFLASDTDIPTPPHVGSLKFLNEVERHLRVDKTYASPVISVTEHARNALRKIATEKPARSLAIFDYFEVEEDLVERYGTRCRPYLVPNICDKHGLHGDRELPKGYRGRGEWLIWGDIQCEPVKIFDSDEALKLRQWLKGMLETNSKLDKNSGSIMGEFLREVDDERKEVVARSLVTSFKIPGHDANYHGSLWEEFADAVYAVSWGDRAMSVVSGLHGKNFGERPRTKTCLLNTPLR